MKDPQSSSETNDALSPEDVQEESRQISRQNREDSPLVQEIHGLISSCFAAYVNYKLCQWLTYGPNFQSVHDTFRQFAHETQSVFDCLAERLRMIGQDPSLSPQTVQQFSVVNRPPAGGTADDRIAEADANAILLIKQFREAITKASSSDDPGTAHLLSGAIQVFERHEWILRQMTKPQGVRS